MEINVNNNVNGNNDEERRSMDIQHNSVFNVQQDGDHMEIDSPNSELQSRNVHGNNSSEMRTFNSQNQMGNFSRQNNPRQRYRHVLANARIHGLSNTHFTNNTTSSPPTSFVPHRNTRFQPYPSTSRRIQLIPTLQQPPPPNLRNDETENIADRRINVVSDSTNENGTNRINIYMGSSSSGRHYGENYIVRSEYLNPDISTSIPPPSVLLQVDTLHSQMRNRNSTSDVSFDLDSRVQHDILRPEIELDSTDHNFHILPDVLDDTNDIGVNTSDIRHYLGRMNIECEHCLALHWDDEKLSKSTRSRKVFGMCCLQGKIKLPTLIRPPNSLIQLYEGSDVRSSSFRQHIRSYNASNAFASLGVKMDDRILHGRGPTSFTIHGELHHQIGSLLPEPGNDPVYAQLYIYDSSAALSFRQRRNPHLRSDVLSIIQETLIHSNELCKYYKQAFEILSSVDETEKNIPARLHYRAGTDRRRYNLPTSQEIAIILPGDGAEINVMRDVVLRLRSGSGLQRISECHPLYLPSHYVLFFPNGELGWSPDIMQTDVLNNSCLNSRVTQLQYYSYRMFDRRNEYSTILRGGALYQEFLVDAWAACEQNRLRYVRENQDTIRADVYKGLTDVAHDGMNPKDIGKRFILPSSHTGSPRNMYETFQDSMAITRYNRHPDIFLTATANPNWPEIQNELKPHQTALDRPDLVARVFELKRKAIMKEIIDKKVFGQVVAYVYTIEFQKRGLPHMHALFFLKHEDKIRTVAQVDKIVSAEFPDKHSKPGLFKTVKRCMVHGPCGHRNPTASCMIDQQCKAKYPRRFSSETTMDQDGYPIYKRGDTGESFTVRGKQVDNRDVVPYNPHLTEMFDCHINVEVCASVRAVKYINKYIYKGDDRTTIILGGCQDEIQQYIDARYISSSEAAWRLLENPMHEEMPNVVRLAVHLPGMHHVVFNSNEPIENILARAEQQESTLTAFFKYCAQNEAARRYTYQEFPQFFVWNRTQKIWTPRKRGFAIGRMYFASPNSGERFYLRLLLTVVKGPKSFEDLKTVGLVHYATFKEACIARGLLEDDDEWRYCLNEASIMNTGSQLRQLFCIILLECCPLHPNLLWDEFWRSICDDLGHKLHMQFQITSPSEHQIADYGLFLIQEVLQDSGKTLLDFPPMPVPQDNWQSFIGNRLIWEQRNLQFKTTRDSIDANISRLNAEQRYAFDIVTDSVINDKGLNFFLNGPAGTGKTFLYNTIASFCRNLGHIVIMVASSGIASLLLCGGRTAHSRFSIPLNVMDNTVCSFNKNSSQAELFRETNLIIWDEVPMQHKYCVETVSRTLQDVRGNIRPFGGITVVLGGDFRQTLPIIPKGVREQFVAASFRNFTLWSHVRILHLVQNMRLDTNNTDDLDFSNFLLQVGTNPSDSIHLPSCMRKCRDLEDLIFSVYPSLNLPGTCTSEYLSERTILAALNDDVSSLNETILNHFPGEIFDCLAADSCSNDIDDAQQISNHYPTEFLNSLNPSSLPPFHLKLKPGCPIMLLSNISPKNGLCNGTRLMVVRCGHRVIEAIILTGDNAGNHPVFIPWISLTPSTNDLPFLMTRRQFPVRLAFAMTINKSQGQSVKYVGVDLRTPVFSHGQLYVALSRCTSSNRISVLLQPPESNSTTNIVYPEVLISPGTNSSQSHTVRVSTRMVGEDGLGLECHGALQATDVNQE